MSLRRSIALVVASFILGSGLTAFWFWRRGSAPLERLRTASDSFTAEPKGCVEINEAASRLGQDACISGRILRVYTSRAGNTFLDFCEDYRHCPFTSVIFAADREKFGELNALAGRQVTIQGKITEYQGRAEIVIREPEQIRPSQ